MLKLLRRLGRALLHGLIRLVVWPGKPLPIDRKRIERVLVIRTDPRVGNVLLTTPLLRALKAGLPHARIELLLARGKEPLVAGLRSVDALEPFDKRDFFRTPWRFGALVRRLRAARYDVVVEAGHWHAFSFTAAWLARATGAPVRIGHDRGLAARFLTHPVAHAPERVNEVEAKLELLGPLGISASGTELETLLGRDGPRVERMLVEVLPKRRFVALNPGARKPDHRWPAASFGDLAARLARRGLVPLVLWGPDEELLAQEVVRASGGAAVLAPPTDLDELAACFRVASVVVTNDTGPMHLACAVGAPTVVCFLAEDAMRWGHPGPKFAGIDVSTAADAVGEVESAVCRFGSG